MAPVDKIHSLDELAASTPRHQQMLATARDLSAAQAAAAKTAPTSRLNIRTLPASPLAKAEAAWSSGLAPSETLGPFSDKLGQPVWVDVFSVVRTLRFARSAGAVPFLVVPVEVIVHHDTLLAPHRPPPTEFDLAAGSVWIQGQQLAGAAPAGGFIGLRISGGTIRLSAASTIGSGDNVVVPATVTVTLDLTLAAPASPTGSGPGADAREAKAALPATVRFVFTSTGARLDHADPARMLAYHCDVGLKLTGAAPSFVSALNLIAFPATQTIPTFSIGGVASTTFMPSASAPIDSAAWTVAVTTADPSLLGQAAGAGALALNLRPGLKATWQGQQRAAALGGCVISVDTQSLAMAAVAAQGEGIRLDPKLGSSPADRLDLSWRTPFPIFFVAQASGSELLWTEARLDASFAKPVDVNGWRLPLHSDAAIVVMLVSAAETLLIIEAALSGNTRNQIGFGLVNAVLDATPPTTLYFAAQFDGTSCTAGGALLIYRLLALLPTLPDPYASSAPSWTFIREGAARTLYSVLTWTKTAQTFDFLLPPTSTLPQLPAKSGGLIPGAPAEAGQTAGIVTTATDASPAFVAKQTGSLLNFEKLGPLVLLDMSTHIDQFGVAFGGASSETHPSLAIGDMRLQLEADGVTLVTVPAVQWEVVHTEQDPGPGPFPEKLTFPNSGVPAFIRVPTATLIPVYPEAAIGRLVDNFASRTPASVASRFTLPFGMIALADLKSPDPTATETRGATLSLNRPTGDGLTGAYQLRIDALDPALAPNESPSLPGFTVQLANGEPGSRSVLGVTPTDIFNTYLGPGGARPLVPVTRLDLSGYGESLFSDWRNPYLDPVAVSQARFDVLIGRTSHEVVQVRTKLFFYGVDLVRTLTMERKNTGVVVRRDSGWKAMGDGTFTFPGSAIVTHPGVIRRITNVANVRETGQIVTVDGYELATVYFDGDLEIDGVVGLVPAKDQLGFIQVTAGGYLPPTAYADALALLGPLGGTVDVTLRVGSGPIAARVHRVDVAATMGMSGPEFAVAAWTSPIFPGGGEWMFLRVDGPTSAPEPVPPAQGVPLIRAGAAGSAPPPTSPYRFADPQDLATPANPAHDYGLVHATGTQRTFFPRPRIDATNTHKIVSTEIPKLADPYVLSTAEGPFPALGVALPFPNNNWAFNVDAAGNYKLQLPANPFSIGYVGRRTLKQAGSVKGDVDYTAAKVTYAVDTSQANPWTFALDGAVKIMNTTALGDIIILATDIQAAANQPGTQFQHPNLKLGGALSIVQNMLTILADLGIQGVMSAQMTNDWSLKVKLTVPFVDATGEALQIPPLVPNPQVKFDDSGVEVELDVAPSMDKAQFALTGQPMFAVQEIPGLYVVGLIKFSIQISTADGTTYALLIGFGVAYEIPAGPFKLKGMFALTMFGFMGDTVLGFGIGFVLKLELAIEPIVSVQIYLEGQLAVVEACRGTGNDTTYGAAKLTFGVEISVCLILSISFEVETTASEVISGPGGAACPLPDVLPSAT
jgi:hypothetical protein